MPYFYKNGGVVKMEGYGMDPKTMDDVEASLLLVEGVALHLGQQREGVLARDWPVVRMRLMHIFATETLDSLKAKVTTEQDHLFIKYGGRWRSKANWAEKMAELVRDMRKGLAEKVHTEHFMRTLCKWCASSKPCGSGIAFNDAFLVHTADGVWDDHPSGKGPDRNCYVYIDHRIHEAQCFDTHVVVGALHTFGVEQQHAVNHVLSTCFLKETASVSMTNFRVFTETPDMCESVDTHGVVGAVTVARPSLKTRRLRTIPYSWWSPSWRSPVSSCPSITVDGGGLSRRSFITQQLPNFPISLLPRLSLGGKLLGDQA